LEYSQTHLSCGRREREREREREKEREREGRERLLNQVTLKYTKKYDTYIYTPVTNVLIYEIQGLDEINELEETFKDQCLFCYSLLGTDEVHSATVLYNIGLVDHPVRLLGCMYDGSKGR
jgi:hypothetical protein